MAQEEAERLQALVMKHLYPRTFPAGKVAKGPRRFHHCLGVAAEQDASHVGQELGAPLEDDVLRVVVEGEVGQGGHGVQHNLLRRLHGVP